MCRQLVSSLFPRPATIRARRFASFGALQEMRPRGRVPLSTRATIESHVKFFFLFELSTALPLSIVIRANFRATFFS